MSNTRFEKFKSEMSKVGVEFDSRIEQKEVDGLLGMYATESIPKGSTLVTFPLRSRIPEHQGVDYGNLSNAFELKTVHSIATKLASNDADYASFFEYCGGLEERKSRSICFFSDEDFRFLQKMNPFLGQVAFASFSNFKHTVKSVQEIDPELDSESIMLAAHIWRERCWGNFGFMPGVDLFNHNTKSLLAPRKKEIDGEEVAVIETVSDIEQGEQIFITYGKKDAFSFLTQYDFYDDSDLHMMVYAQRIEQEVKDDFIDKIVNLLKKTYDIAEYEKRGKRFFRVLEPNAFFLEHGPNTKMVELASRLSVNTDVQLLQGKSDDQSTAAYLLQTLLAYKEANKVGSFSLNDIDPKFKPYHQMLTREAVVIEQNINVVKANLMSHS